MILSFVFLVLSTSCTKEETVRTEFSDFTWYTSVPNSLQPFNIKSGTNISFMDLSQGTITHEWKIEEGNFYLSSNFVKGGDLTPYIIPNKGVLSSDVTVHVLFPKIGVYKVTLTNTYKEKVVFPGVVPIEAVKVGDVWVAEKVFTITVTDVVVP